MHPVAWLGYAAAEAAYCWSLTALALLDPRGRQGVNLALSLVSAVEYWDARRYRRKVAG